MTECWSMNPSARLTALRVKKTMFLYLLSYYLSINLSSARLTALRVKKTMIIYYLSNYISYLYIYLHIHLSIYLSI